MSVTEITSPAQFKSYLENNTNVFVDFYATWCGPCKAVAPQIDKLANQHTNPGTLTFVKVDIDSQTDLARRYNIRAVPTFIMFESGQAKEPIQGPNLPKINSAIQAAAMAVKAEPPKPAASVNTSSDTKDYENTTSVSGGYTLSKGSGWKTSLN